MDSNEREALLDYFSCAAIEAAEGLREALEELRRELIADEPTDG